MNKINTNKKILVIDDDPVVINLLAGRLSESGYELLTATEADVGLQRAMTEQPDLIILDVMMPIINGFNICSLLKTEIKHKSIPIILLTSRSQEEDLEIGRKAGADAHLTKPVNMEILLAKVKEILKV